MSAAPAAAQSAGSPPVIVRGGGWGHSVGLSQYGACAQALAGRNHVDILRHYYTGVNVGGDSRVPGEIAVGLLQEQDVIRVRTGSRNGAAPSHSIVVNLGNGTHDVVWCGDCGPHAVTFEGAEFVLRDQGGAEKGRGPGPVRIDYEFLGGNPTLLRLPQLLSAPDQAKLEATLAAEGKRAGSYQWGRLDISRIRPLVGHARQPELRRHRGPGHRDPRLGATRR